MNRPALPPLAWKWLICLLALGALTLAIGENRHGWKALLEGRQGSLGMQLEDPWGFTPAGRDTQQLRLLDLDPGSPLRALRPLPAPGTLVTFDRNLDRWRKFGVGEQVGLTLHEAGGARRVRVTAQAAPIPFVDYFETIGRYLLAIPALLFCLMIGLKQPEERAYRALALVFLILSLDTFYTYNYSPPGPLFAFAKLADSTTRVLLWNLCVIFALSFQAYSATPARAWLVRLFHAFRVLAFGAAGYSLWFGLGHEAPYLWLLTIGVMVGGLALCVASLVNGLRHCTGEMRQRHLWLLLSFAAGAVPSTLTSIPALDLAWNGLRVTVMAAFAGLFLMYLGLAYAVLRHSIFNFSFAISRALVFSVVSLILLSVFGVAQWLAGPALSSAGSHAVQRHGLIDAVVALLVYLSFHHMQCRIERRVERVLFHKWQENEHRLREFVRQAAHISEPDALLAALAGALDRFSDGAGAAIYLARPDGCYGLATGATLAAAPPLLARDDGVSVALRAGRGPTQCAPLQTIAIGELALPMSHRGALNGFVILGSKQGGESYRPDENEVLGFAVHQAGLDLHALRVEALEAEMQELAHQAERQGDELRLLAGRRQAARTAAGDPAGVPG